MSLKLLGDVVLLEPTNETGYAGEGGIMLPNHYKKPTITYRVLAVGPGQWRRKQTRNGFWKKLAAYDQPEVSVGDMVLCRAALDADVVKHNFDDGTGRVIVHSRGILASWRETAAVNQ